MDMDVDDSGLRFSEFQYHDSVNSRDDQYTDGYMSREQAMERKRAENSDNVSEGTGDGLHFREKKYEELQLVDLNGVEFRDIDEVDTFYSYYSLAMGFSVRKQKMDKDKEGVVTRRQLVCSKEGQRKVQDLEKGPEKGMSWVTITFGSIVTRL